jgi:hypothetical protein
MKSTRLSAAVASLALIWLAPVMGPFPGSARAGQAEAKNLPGIDFKPGGLKLPLTVYERSGVERKGAVVSGGVPFPPGFLTDVNKLAVVDKDGRPVVGQATVMVPWRKPAYDDSVQWALVSFAADVPANGKAVYYLTDSAGVGTGRADVPRSIKATKGNADITVETGAATFTIPLAGNALIS